MGHQFLFSCDTDCFIVQRIKMKQGEISLKGNARSGHCAGAINGEIYLCQK